MYSHNNLIRAQIHTLVTRMHAQITHFVLSHSTIIRQLLKCTCEVLVFCQKYCFTSFSFIHISLVDLFVSLNRLMLLRHNVSQKNPNTSVH